jgi:hypothetical protein
MRRGSKPVIDWKTRVRSFVGTWPMWVAALALGSVLAGIAVGVWHPQTYDRENLPKGNVVTTPGGAPVTDITEENVHRQIFSNGEPAVSGNSPCPQGNVTSKLTTTVSADQSLVIASSLHVTVTGVLPAHPPLNLNDPNEMRMLAICFIATDADIKSINWSDGKLDADLDLSNGTVAWNDAIGWTDRFGYTNQLLKNTLSLGHSTLTVNVCEPHDEWDGAGGLHITTGGPRTICVPGADTTVLVRVKRPVEKLESTPFPTSQQTTDDYADSTWQFAGPMPPVTVTLNVPKNVTATSWLYWSRSRNFEMSFIHSWASVDLYYIADSSAIWLALIAAAVLLRGKQATGELLDPTRRLVLIVLAGLLLGFEIRALGYLMNNIGSGIIAVITWGLLAVAAGPKRLLPVIAVLSAAALTPFCWLAISPPGDEAISLILTEFCLAFVLLVVTAAWCVWTQIVTLFDLANLGPGTAIWHERYRQVIFCLVVAAFMFAVGFPIGEVLTIQASGVAGSVANNLIWSAGVAFRPALEWVSLLLAISYLAGYLISRPPGTIAAPRKRSWGGRVQWVRVCDRAVAAMLALILCLSAPWTNRFALDAVIPVWVLQFGILWLGFGLLTSSAGLRALRRRRNPRLTYLLQAATATPPNEATTSDGGAFEAVGVTPVATRDQKAGSRLLILGSQPGRLANARAAAQIASVIAIIPVAYLIWTTLANLGQLNTNTGILIVALVAILEFARWVVSGFVFGYLYPKLPGRIGPLKGLSFAAIWTLSCVGPLGVAQISGSNLAHETFYRIAQFALFAIVLAVLVDLNTVRSAGGTWRDLHKVYDLQNYAELAAAIAPAALLALTVAQQIMAGSGIQVAQTLVSGITSVLNGPG